jgi:hypothetical protein
MVTGFIGLVGTHNSRLQYNTQASVLSHVTYYSGDVMADRQLLLLYLPSVDSTLE